MTHATEDTDIIARLRMADPVDLAELERTVAPLRARVKQRAIKKGSLMSEPIPVSDPVAPTEPARQARPARDPRRR
jgi:hypothetical protein